MSKTMEQEGTALRSLWVVGHRVTPFRWAGGSPLSR